MVKSRKLSFIVLALFFLSIFTGWGTQKASAASSPTDISGNWANTQIIYLISQGVVSGYEDGTFKPNNSINRAEFITMINHAFKFTTPSSIYYSDVKTSDWFYLDLCRAKAAGYISGYPDGTMQPRNNISRQEAAVILAKALNLGTSSYNLTFTDASKIPSWSLSAIKAMSQAGYISGYPDGTFKPTNTISRAEAAAMLFACKSKWTATAVTGVSLNKTTLYLDTDEEYDLTATVSPSNATNKEVVWSSSDEDVAEVDDDGTVTAVDDGTCTIKVKTSDGSYTASCKVYVGYSSNDELTVSPDDFEMEPEASKTIKVYIPDDYDTGDVDEDNISWDIDGDDEIIDDIDFTDDDIDTYDDYIRFTIDSSDEEGDCTITFNIEIDGDEYEAECDVTVDEDASDTQELRLSTADITMETEDSKTVKIYVPGDCVASDTGDIDWDIDGDDEIIDDIDYADLEDYDAYIKFTIDSSEEEGDCTITFNIEIDGDDYTAECDVTVENPNELSLSSDEIEMETEDTKTVKVYMPDDYDTSDVDDVNWDISGDDEIIDDVDYADLDDYDAYIKFTIDSSEDEGDCTIKFDIEIDGDDYKASCDITVEDGTGELSLSTDEIEMDTDDVKTVKVYMPDGYTTDDLDYIDWSISGDDEIIDDMEYEDLDDYDGYVKFNIFSSGEEGDCEINFELEVDTDSYEGTCQVTVNS